MNDSEVFGFFDAALSANGYPLEADPLFLFRFPAPLLQPHPRPISICKLDARSFEGTSERRDG
jgi:hypothetical protein